MSIYTPTQISEVFQQVYDENTKKRLFAMKLAKHISQFMGQHSVRATMLSDLYDPDFKIFYSFSHSEFDVFNPWLKKICKEHPIDGKTTGRMDDMHFVYTEDFDGEVVSVPVFGRLSTET